MKQLKSPVFAGRREEKKGEMERGGNCEESQSASPERGRKKNNFSPGAQKWGGGKKPREF